MFSKRIMDVKPSGTVMLANKVKELKAKGLDILSFTLGEPDFTTPQHIVDSCKTALDQGMTHYGSSLGIPELREAVAERARSVNGLDAEVENVIILPTKLALYMAAQALLNPGDEVLIPDPGWVSYGPMVRLAGGVPVPVRMRYDDGWYWHPDDIRSCITGRTKAVIVNTPSNPTGSVMSRDSLKQLARIAHEKGLVIISDEVYENLVYEGGHVSIGSMEEVSGQTITISGFSKSYAMTGWRIGWMVAGEATISMVNKLQQHSLTCVPPFIQMGALEALRGGDGCVTEMRDEFRARRDLMIPLLNEIEGISCEMPKGAFYAFFRADLGMGSAELAERLLEEVRVALTPGSAFGAAGEMYMRMSYASSREKLEDGARRIADFVGKQPSG